MAHSIGRPDGFEPRQGGPRCLAELKALVKDKLKRLGLHAGIGDAFFFAAIGAASTRRIRPGATDDIAPLVYSVAAAARMHARFNDLAMIAGYTVSNAIFLLDHRSLVKSILGRPSPCRGRELVLAHRGAGSVMNLPESLTR
jgi:hypothetical protein